MSAGDNGPAASPPGGGRSPSGPAPGYPIESVSNALKLLLMFRDQETIRVADAGKALGVARSTAHRLFAMLAYFDFVTQDPVTRVYHAGPALAEVGLAVVRHMDIRAQARSHLIELRDDVNETVHLVRLEDTNVLFLDSVESTRPVRVGSRTGQLMPAHVTSAGRSLLAELPVEEVRSRYGSDPLPPGTERAITSLAELEQVLDEVRASGYSTSFGESERDIGAVSVAIRDRGGRAVAAISVSAPIDRLDPQRGEQIAQAAKRAAARIGAALA